MSRSSQSGRKTGSGQPGSVQVDKSQAPVLMVTDIGSLVSVNGLLFMECLSPVATPNGLAMRENAHLAMPVATARKLHQTLGFFLEGMEKPDGKPS